MPDPNVTRSREIVASWEKATVNSFSGDYRKMLLTDIARALDEAVERGMRRAAELCPTSIRGAGRDE